MDNDTTNNNVDDHENVKSTLLHITKTCNVIFLWKFIFHKLFEKSFKIYFRLPAIEIWPRYSFKVSHYSIMCFT